MSRGASFLAPLGNLEFVDGQFPSTADVLVEVTSLDAVHQAAAAWLRAQGGDQAVERLSPITETHWKSRIFTVEPEQGFSFSFWAWTDPQQGKPVAVEVNLELVPRQRHAEHRLAEGDRLEIVTLVGGG